MAKPLPISASIPVNERPDAKPAVRAAATTTSTGFQRRMKPTTTTATANRGQ